MAGGRPGPVPQTAKREQYAALITRGASFSEACRIVGINRRTGKRWRHGRTITGTATASGCTIREGCNLSARS
jgi:transposase-like protein